MSPDDASPAGFQLSGSASDSYERYVSVIMSPFVEAVVQRARLSAGQAVLDVACGTGFAARAAARVVGPAGRVVGLDLNAGMLQTAAASSPPAAPAIEWVEGSALELDFEDDSFDAVVCQQGVQFFPDLVRAAGEMARVARTGGRVVASFWSPLDTQPYFGAQLRALERKIGAGIEPIARGFGLSSSSARDAFESAGLTELTVEEVTAEISLPPLADFLAGQISGLPVAAAFASLAPSARDSVLDEIASALAPYALSTGGHRVPLRSHVISALAG